MSFPSNAAERARVCNALTRWIRGRDLWVLDGNGEISAAAARRLLHDGISSGERTMLKFAWHVWRMGSTPAEGTKLDVSVLLHGLDNVRLEQIGSLLVAFATDDGIPLIRWLDKYNGSLRYEVS